ncbi:MAG: sialidase family protein [Candidatus Korobacteraceae bacterium]
MVLLLLAGTSCRSSRPSYVFEDQPRPVLAELGIDGARNPKLAITPAGVLFLLAAGNEQGQTRLFFAMSHDGGDTFMPPVAVSEPGEQVSSHGQNSPSLAIGATEIYAVWEQMQTEGPNKLMFPRSLSFGHSFEKPIRVTDKQTPSFNGFSTLGVAPTGDVYVAWLDGRDADAQPGTFSIYLAKSTDRGASFGPNVRVGQTACPCCRPTLAFGSNGQILVIWRKVFAGDIRDMVVSSSSDGGASFAAPVRVAEDNWKLSGCPESGPAVAVKGGTVYVVWYSEGGDQPGLRLTQSEDSGETFSKARLLSGDVLDANHPSLSVSDDGRVLAVFEGRASDGGGGWGAKMAYFMRLDDSGNAKPVALVKRKDSVSRPVIAAGTADRAFMAWTESGKQKSTVFLLRGRKANK